jgi:hypothetical protein
LGFFIVKASVCAFSPPARVSALVFSFYDWIIVFGVSDRGFW